MELIVQLGVSMFRRKDWFLTSFLKTTKDGYPQYQSDLIVVIVCPSQMTTSTPQAATINLISYNDTSNARVEI